MPTLETSDLSIYGNQVVTCNRLTLPGAESENKKASRHFIHSKGIMDWWSLFSSLWSFRWFSLRKSTIWYAVSERCGQRFNRSHLQGNPNGQLYGILHYFNEVRYCLLSMKNTKFPREVIIYGSCNSIPH